MTNTKAKGITLISLVVTIIIMLILAGVTLNLIAGGDGILGKAETAVNETEKQTAKEIISLKITSKQMDSYAENGRNATLKELAVFLDADDEIQYVYKESKAKASLDWWGEKDNFSSIFTKLEEYPYEFEIESKDNVIRLAAVDGEKIETEVADTNFTETEEYKAMYTTIKNLQEEVEKLKTELEQDKDWTLITEFTSANESVTTNIDLTGYTEIEIRAENRSANHIWDKRIIAVSELSENTTQNYWLSNIFTSSNYICGRVDLTSKTACWGQYSNQASVITHISIYGR